MRPDLVRLHLDQAEVTPHRKDEGCSDLKILPNRVTVTTQSPRSSILILTDACWPGWTASVDGSPVRVWPIHAGIHRGVVLTPGHHNVVFDFEPGVLWLGLCISGGSLTAIACAALIAYRRRLTAISP
jgi:uncharacterized membrane protein YfhO